MIQKVKADISKKRILCHRKNRIAVILSAILMAGIICQLVMTQMEKRDYPPVGSYLNVGSYQMHYYKKGSGDLTFVFITGSGTPCAYTDFFELQNRLSEKGQTISFDHAGSGWSTDTDVQRTIGNLTNELAVLIDAVAPDKPIVIICHSLGSLEAIRFAQCYPEKVKGIIFLDSGSPEYYAADSELAAFLLNRGTAFFRTTGIHRFLGTFGCMLPLYGQNDRNRHLSGKTQKIDQAMYYRLAGNPDTLAAIQQMNENAKEVWNGGSLGELPILVLSSDSGKAWEDVQAQLAAWSKQSEQITLKYAGHYLYWTNLEEVLNHIDGFVK
ncbi:MAG: alpha/beta hydrolase [bacterium]|nr:alpha/beta hydrolase [bacterium]